MSKQLSSKDYLKLSAFLDGQLSEKETDQLKSRIKADPELKNELEALAQTRLLLQKTPVRKAPKDFRLAPEMVRQQHSRSRQPLIPVMRFSSAIAALLLIITIFLDPVTNPLQKSMVAMEAPQMMEMVYDEAEVEMVEEMPMLAEMASEEAYEEPVSEEPAEEAMPMAAAPEISAEEPAGTAPTPVPEELTPRMTAAPEGMGEQEPPAERVAAPGETEAQTNKIAPEDGVDTGEPEMAIAAESETLAEPENAEIGMGSANDENLTPAETQPEVIQFRGYPSRISGWAITRIILAGIAALTAVASFLIKRKN
jgi:hypothetical protein